MSAVAAGGTRGFAGPETRCLTVAVTGAFLTGHPLNVPIDEYKTVQLALRGSLPARSWQTRSLRRRATFDSGGGFTEALPLVLARRDGSDFMPWLSAALDGLAGSCGEPPQYGPMRSAAIKELRVDVYDLGVAVMVAWLEVRAEATASLGDVARAMRKLVRLRDTDGESPSRFAVALQDAATDTVKEYVAAIASSAADRLQPAWLSGAVAGSREAAATTEVDDDGRLLWLHPIGVIRRDDLGAEKLEELAPPFHACRQIEGGVFAPGIGWSAVVLETSASRGDADLPVELTLLHWAYFALYAEIDRGLLHTLDHPRWTTSDGSVHRLESDSGEVFAGYLRIQRARARLDSSLAERGGDGIAIWDAISRVQRFDALSQSVERKINALEAVARRRVEQATSRYSTRISNRLFALALLALVTVITAVAAAVTGEPTGDRDWWRWLILCAAALLGAAVAVWLIRAWRDAREHSRARA